jgi:hypothetical protein
MCECVSVSVRVREYVCARTYQAQQIADVDKNSQPVGRYCLLTSVQI